MNRGTYFIDKKGVRYRCEEVLSPNLFVASKDGHGDYAFIQKENGRFSRVVPKFTPDNVVVGSMVTGAFRNARWNVLGIEGGKVRGEVDFFTPDNRVVRKEFSDWDFSIFLEMLNSVFIVIPTKEDLPCDCKFISPQNAPNWKFRIIEEYGDDIVLVELFYKNEKIDTRKVPRSLIAKWMNTPFEFGEPEMKGKEKMAHETSTDYESGWNVTNSVLFYTTDELTAGKTVVYSNGQKKVTIVEEPMDCLKRIVRFGDEEDSREINVRKLCAMINCRKEDVRETDIGKKLCVYKRNNHSEIYAVTSYDRNARKVDVNVLSSKDGSYIRQIVSIPVADFLSEVNDKFPAHSDVIKRLIDCRKEIEDIVKNCKNPLDRLLDDDMPWRKQVDVLNANLPKGYSIKPQIVETGFAEELKHGLHKD